MSIRKSLKNFWGYGEGGNGEYYWASNFQKTPEGVAPTYSMYQHVDNGVGHALNGYSAPICFAYAACGGANSRTYAQLGSNGGRIFAEGTFGLQDWTMVNNPATDGRGLLGDAKGRLLYFQATQIGMFNGTTWTNNWKTGITSGNHPSDTYEGNTYFGNVSTIGLIDSTDAMNTSAFTLPSSFNVVAVRSNPRGLLIGANSNNKGYLILWDGIADRSTVPWIETSQILGIDRYGSDWVVLTSREAFITNGSSITKKVWSYVDYPVSVRGSSASTWYPQRILCVGQRIFISQIGDNARNRAGVVSVNMETGKYEFISNSLGVSYNGGGNEIQALYIDDTGSRSRILYTYALSDAVAGSLYSLGEVFTTGATTGSSIIIPFDTGDSKTKKIEKVVLNTAMFNSAYLNSTFDFGVTVKTYDFSRALYQYSQTSGISTSYDQLKVNGTLTTLARTQIGDEITITIGVNRGLVRTVTDILNQGTANEVLVLDSALPAYTEGSVIFEVQPWKTINRRTLGTTRTVGEMMFDAKNCPTGKRFLIKIETDVISNACPIQITSVDVIYSDEGYKT